MKKILAMSIFLVLSLSPVFAASETVKIIGQFEGEEVGFSVPDQIVLPLVANGYSAQASFDLINIGNTAISFNSKIEGTIENDYRYNPVFDLLEISSNPVDYSLISDYEWKMQRPEILGGNRSEKIYLNLDLDGTEFEFNNSEEEVNLVITAMAYN